MGAKLHKKYVLPKSFWRKYVVLPKFIFVIYVVLPKSFCCKSVVINVIKDLNFHISKEKAARISCENILAALYGSLKKNFISCRKREQGSRWYSEDHGSPCALLPCG